MYVIANGGQSTYSIKEDCVQLVFPEGIQRLRQRETNLDKEYLMKLKKEKPPLGFWDMLRLFCLESTIVPLKYFYLYPDKVSRCFWAVGLTLSLVFALILTALLYGRFAQMPTRITIENQFAPVSRLPWPALTICSPNQLTLRGLQHFSRTLIDGNLSLDVQAALPQLLGFYEMLPEVNKEWMHHLQHLIDSNRHFVNEVMTSLAQSCDRFLKMCLFRDEVVECGELFKPILTMHGLCCIFNSPYQVGGLHMNTKNPNFTAFLAKGGAATGTLSVALDYEPWDALNGTLLSIGAVRVMIHDSTELPADEESCLVHSDVEAFHYLHGTHTYCSDEVKVLHPHSRRCLFEDEGETRWFQRHGYRNSDCDQLCFVLSVKRRCRCAMLYFVDTDLPKVPICDVTKIPCIMDAKRNLMNIEDMRSCSCPRDCDSRQYKSDMNIGNLFMLDYLTVNRFKAVKFTGSTALMHFSFANSFYVVQKQETVMSLINLVSNLGGVFGLCLGCSIFSVLEILFLIYYIIKNNIKKYILRRKKRSAD